MEPKGCIPVLQHSLCPREQMWDSVPRGRFRQRRRIPSTKVVPNKGGWAKRKPWRRMPWWSCLCPSLRLGCCKQQWLAAARNRLMGLCGVKIKFVQNFVTAWLRQFQEVNDRATIMVLLVVLYDDKLGTSFFNTTEVMKVFKTTSTRATLKHVEMGKSDGCF